MQEGKIGYLVKPRAYVTREMLQLVPFFGVENDAFNGYDEARFFRMLELLSGYREKARFVPAPDVVGDFDKTLYIFGKMQPVLKDLGFPVAIVTQDGATVDRIPWSDVDALFVGGSNRHKDRESRDLILEAKRRGLWVHVGRVNTRRRIRYCLELGVDTFDGTGFDRFSNRELRNLFRWEGEYQRQIRLL